MANVGGVGAARRKAAAEVEDEPRAKKKEPSAAERASRAHEAAAGYADLASHEAPQRRAPERPVTSAEMASKVHPERTFTELEPLQNEVIRLRGELAKATDPALRKALAARTGQLSNQWRQMARAKGLEPPPATFDPSHANDRELHNAFLWAVVGNSYPIGTFANPTDPERFLGEVIGEMALQDPKMLDGIVFDHPNDPGLIPLLREDLRRRGDPLGSDPNATLQDLLRRRGELRNQDAVKEWEAEQKRCTMGLDGFVGTRAQVDRYEAQQYLKALHPKSTLGGIFAAGAVALGANIPEMRAAGKLGDMFEALSDRRPAGVKPHW